MPIRMSKDEEPERGNSGGGNSGGGGGNGGLILLLIGLLTFVFRKPKIGIPLLILAGIVYWFSSGDVDSSSSNGLSKGCAMSQEEFDKVEVFEPLAADRNSLPVKVTLEQYTPTAKSQGSQGSCVGWASAYNGMTILYSAASGSNPDQVAFSPSFLYNQIRLDGCQGSYIRKAMDNMQQVGSLSFQEFAYNEESCDNEPDASLKSKANEFKISGYNRLTRDDDNYEVDLLAIKQNLAQGAPVIIGMSVGGSFEDAEMNGAEFWRPTQRDLNNKENFGGHAMCVIGYDNQKEGGAFLIANSWGPEFGQNGRFWMSYTDFSALTGEAYGLYPMRPVGSKATKGIDVGFGLVRNDNREYIPLRSAGRGTFESINTVAAGTKFKIEVRNSTECYTYVFAQDTNQTAYTLFPYTPKHSPYCGIVGSRLFPKDYSMEPDAIGTKDFMAVVVSRKPLDPEAIIAATNQNVQGSFYAMLSSALSENGFRPMAGELKDGHIQLNDTQFGQDACTMVVIGIKK